MRHVFTLGLITVLAAIAQTSTNSGPLNNQKIITLVQAGISPAEVSRIISSSPSVDFNLTPAFTDQLLHSGVSEETIRLMAARENSGPVKTLIVNASGDESAAPQNVDALPDEIGIYYRQGDRWVALPPEIVNWQTGGVAKSVSTLGVVRGDLNGRLKNGSSHTRLQGPSVDLLVYTPEGTRIEEYQLLKLRGHPNAREFRTVTGGIFHVSGGALRDTVEFESQQIAKRMWTIHMILDQAEYGFLPPGVYESRSPSAQMGKMFTFSVQ